MYGFRTRHRKTLEKHVEKIVVDDLHEKSSVVPHSTMHKKIDNVLFDLFENVSNIVNVPNNKSKHVNRSKGEKLVKKVWSKKNIAQCHVAQYAPRANSKNKGKHARVLEVDKNDVVSKHVKKNWVKKNVNHVKLDKACITSNVGEMSINDFCINAPKIKLVKGEYSYH
ncbi:hypothetical protein Dsin_019061 [Dipteronia sinensis]|uniref:Uncharacterized protein n=1 Tax=Dipteronia sinensis TaxID=43782 RepID=A0AAE0E2E0_9ROSI|nr:hypothetical protein Dsin_019061 [Dipteronia sinensis]